VKKDLQEALGISKTATASVGKYDRKLNHEPKNTRVKNKPGNKRSGVTSALGNEKERAMKLITKMERGPVTIHTAKGSRLADAEAPDMIAKKPKKGGKPARITAKGAVGKKKK
jgi:regulator of ribosome biosynthesis